MKPLIVKPCTCIQGVSERPGHRDIPEKLNFNQKSVENRGFRFKNFLSSRRPQHEFWTQNCSSEKWWRYTKYTPSQKFQKKLFSGSICGNYLIILFLRFYY